MRCFQSSAQPTDGDSRPLEPPQPLTGYYEAQATHEVWSDEAGGWVPAVVEHLGSEECAFVVPAMQTWPEEGV